MVSDSTANANGQQQELNLVLDRVEPVAGTSKIIPLFINGAKPSNYPKALKSKNGDFLSSPIHLIHGVCLLGFCLIGLRLSFPNFSYFPIPVTQQLIDI